MTWWKASGLTAELTPGDLAITDHRYGVTLPLLACRGCGFRFADPEATADLVALYGALDDPAYEEGADARRVPMRGYVEAIRRRAPHVRSLLDVGAANGLLVEEAQRAGIDAMGVEPSATLAARARARGLDVRTGTLPLAPLGERRFDAVTLVDVIEHVSDPLGLLRAVRAVLAPAGVVLVVTPDVASVAARTLRSRWWHYRVAHVGYFTRPTLSDALRRTGFVPTTWWRPGWVFELGYLVERIGEYVPPARRLAERAPASVRQRTVRVNPWDSLAVLAVAGD